MAKWQMTCTCGEVMEEDAESKEEAVNKLMERMTPEATKTHMDEKHPGQPVPSQEEVRAGFEATAREV